MKKVGIVTFHRAHNYGAILQVFALQTKLQELNYDVKIINYVNEAIDRQYKLIRLNRGCIKEDLKYFKINRKRYKIFKNFIKTNLKQTKEYTLEELKKNAPEYYAYITGSDQVWNIALVKELNDVYALNFGSDRTKRISYAASIGNSTISKEEEEEYKRKLKNLDFISVREKKAKEILQPILNKDISVVLDPTLLIEKEKWDVLAKEERIIKEKYIFTYVVEENKEYRKIIEEISKKTNLKIIIFEKVKNINDSKVLSNEYCRDPFEFLNLIKYAEYVVTTSFHATVFSILFNKKFFVVPHELTGSRVTNLLSLLKIDYRIFRTLEEFNKFDIDKEDNYKEVNDILNDERRKSIDFLKNAIEE